MEKLRKLVRLSSKRGGNPKMAFEHFDAHLKGTISREQFKQGLKQLDITLLEDEMSTVMKMFGTGTRKDRLDYGQFLMAVAPNRASVLSTDVNDAIARLKRLVRARSRDKDLKDPFLHFDEKKVGWFDARQLEAGLSMLRIKVNEEKTQLIFEAMDMNGDGKIDFNDFRQFFDGGDDDDDDKHRGGDFSGSARRRKRRRKRKRNESQDMDLEEERRTKKEERRMKKKETYTSGSLGHIFNAGLK